MKRKHEEEKMIKKILNKNEEKTFLSKTKNINKNKERKKDEDKKTQKGIEKSEEKNYLKGKH